MYQQKFKPTPLFDRLVRPFVERLPKESGEKLTIIYPRTRSRDSVRQQWYNWIHHHARGLYSLSWDLKVYKEHYWKLFVTRTVEEEVPKEEK